MPRIPTVVTLFRWIGQAITVLIVLAILSSALIYCNRPGQIPDIVKVQWAIQTYTQGLPSRIYLAAEVEYAQDGTPTIKGYYSFDGANWHKQRGDKRFPEAIYGKVDIRRR